MRPAPSLEHAGSVGDERLGYGGVAVPGSDVEGRVSLTVLHVHPGTWRGGGGGGGEGGEQVLM